MPDEAPVTIAVLVSMSMTLFLRPWGRDLNASIVILPSRRKERFQEFSLRPGERAVAVPWQYCWLSTAHRRSQVMTKPELERLEIEGGELSVRLAGDREKPALL